MHMPSWLGDSRVVSIVSVLVGACAGAIGNMIVNRRSESRTARRERDHLAAAIRAIYFELLAFKKLLTDGEDVALLEPEMWERETAFLIDHAPEFVFDELSRVYRQIAIARRGSSGSGLQASVTNVATRLEQYSVTSYGRALGSEVLRHLLSAKMPSIRTDQPMRGPGRLEIPALILNSIAAQPIRDRMAFIEMLYWLADHSAPPVQYSEGRYPTTPPLKRISYVVSRMGIKTLEMRLMYRDDLELIQLIAVTMFVRSLPTFPWASNRIWTIRS